MTGVMALRQRRLVESFMMKERVVLMWVFKRRIVYLKCVAAACPQSGHRSSTKDYLLFLLYLLVPA